MGRFLYATIWTTLLAAEGHFKSAIDEQNPSAQAHMKNSMKELEIIKLCT